MNTQWLHPRTGLVHKILYEGSPQKQARNQSLLVFPPDLEVTVLHPKFIACGIHVYVDEAGCIADDCDDLQAHELITIPWVKTSDAPTCLECAGHVVETGVGTTDWSPTDPWGAARIRGL